MKKELILLCFLVIIAVCSAQTTGIIKGKITNTRNLPVKNVSVVIKELEMATHTDSTGTFYFKEILEGEYTLWFSHYSYIDTRRAMVKVNAERVTNVNMSLLPFQEERYIKSRNESGMIKNKNNVVSTESGVGSLSGNIEDKYGNPIIYANIRIMETNQTVQSNDLGEYQLADISPGIYTVSYSKPGYEERRFIGIQVKGNENTTKKVKLPFLQINFK
jgi:hypothetical protein